MVHGLHLTEKFKSISLEYVNNTRVLYISDREETMIFNSAKDVDDFFNKKFLKNVDLSLINKAYFDPTSKFPRARLAAYTDIKRSLKPEKADIIVMGEVSVRDSYSECIVGYSPSENEYYSIGWYTASYYHSGKDEKTFDVIRKHVALPEDLYFVFRGCPVVPTSDQLKSLKSGSHFGLKPFVSDKDLNEAINRIIPPAEQDDLDSISEFLNSRDMPTVELGMKLLQNYNVTETACQVGLTILQYGNNIYQTKAVNSVGFLNLLTSLELTRYDLSYFNPNSVHEYLVKFVKISKNDDDKIKAKEIVINILEDRLKRYFADFSDATNVFNLELELKIK